MSKCKHEIFGGKCDIMSQDDFCKCVGADICAFHEPVTNGDRIRSMTDEELAKYTSNGCPPWNSSSPCYWTGTCYECWLEWLKSPYREERENG